MIFRVIGSATLLPAVRLCQTIFAPFININLFIDYAKILVPTLFISIISTFK